MNSIVNHANGSTFLEISKSNFRQVGIVLPSQDARHLFDNAVKPLIKEIFLNEEEVQTLIDSRDSLLPRLMKGEI